ncbi:MAG: glycosyltransferase family 4 protein [Chloroflexi bacterium]|jgi:colanic acid biosynthesis glycosyl transferase WcaI|nr:glycosyltransferase family 4 protein [Chloroflexota bacterium]MBT4073003.1 glycosyltransferase family 4 protein [Chloroflexota bacterium]MBT4516081.1 glycosyltransferase family 4 protein [Chloroflexota bacterium]MBT5320683.1 glycosyltransferase family 4 protein [Chloroflexota bacterium]MBT6680751.1 glycosyltransferase family 4 protein [Chloroflexota bacterium]
MTHLLILSLIFPPDNVSTAHLMGELSGDLVARGDKVTVLTTMPHFNRDESAEKDQPIRPFWGPFLRKSEFNGATVYHTPSLSRLGALSRVLGWLIFHVVSLIAGLMLPRRVDVILAPSPPLTVGVVAWLLGLWHRTSFIYNAQELYPDIAVNLGVTKNRLLISVLYKLENFVYATAGVVTVISEPMREQILSKGVPPEKVVTIPNWVDTATINVLPKDNGFSREHGVENDFVVCYAGNMGLAQNFEEIIEAAAILRGVPGIKFMLIGDGVKRPEIWRMVEELGLSNVIVLPFQDYHLVPHIYASSDLSYVPLHGEVAAHALPSKVYRIMASGRTILAVARQDSGVSALVAKSGSGLVVEPGTGELLAEAITKAASEPGAVSAMGAAGREYVEQNYSRQKIVSQYAELISGMNTRAL